MADEAAIDCNDPNSLIDPAKCYKCIPTGMQPEVMIYLLNEILGTGLTPQQLMANSACMKCIPAGFQSAVQTWLLCTIATKLGA
jgi:hypothetical protein